MEELEAIMQKFAASGWDLIAVPAQEWLDGKAVKDTLLIFISIFIADVDRIISFSNNPFFILILVISLYGMNKLSAMSQSQ